VGVCVCVSSHRADGLLTFMYAPCASIRSVYERECVGGWVTVCMCMCGRERVCVCVCTCEGECVCVCVSSHCADGLLTSMYSRLHSLCMCV